MNSAYDAGAPSFDRHRALPNGVPAAIRSAVLAATAPEPRLLDLGCGTGRTGYAFVAAADDYIGIDRSLGMLREFARRFSVRPIPALIQGDGQHLPFPNANFDAVMLMQMVGAAQNWRGLVTEAIRVLRPGGALIVGHTVAPAAGLEAQMKQRLASLLQEAGVPSYHADTRDIVQSWLEARSQTSDQVMAADWTDERTPRRFLLRQHTGARFAQLPAVVQTTALQRLEEWAMTKFGSLDAIFPERYAFELQVFKF